jgi:hypothetical protein
VGKVEDSYGQPLRDSQLSIKAGHGHYEEGKISKNSGRFVQVLSPGYHAVNVSMQGYDSEKKTVYVTKGLLKTVEFVLSKSSYPVKGINAQKEVFKSDNSSIHQEYFYYPRKDFLSIRQAHPRHFDVYRYKYLQLFEKFGGFKFNDSFVTASGIMAKLWCCVLDRTFGEKLELCLMVLLSRQICSWNGFKTLLQSCQNLLLKQKHN